MDGWMRPQATSGLAPSRQIGASPCYSFVLQTRAFASAK